MALGPRLLEARALHAAAAENRDLRFELLGAFAALVIALVTIFGPHKASALAVQQRLGAAVRDALTKAHYLAIGVRMDGQTAIVYGVVSTPKDAADVSAIALGAAGRGGLWYGGVVRVINHVTVAHAELATPRPFVRMRNDRNWGSRSRRARNSGILGLGAGLAGGPHGPPEGAFAQDMTASLANFGTVYLPGASPGRRGGAPCFI